MLKTYLYIPEQLEEKIQNAVRIQKTSKAKVIRAALQEGLAVFEKNQAGGAEILLKLADLGRKNKINGPKDASVNHDHYLWGLPKKKSK